MKAARFVGPQQFTLEEIPVPVISDEEVLVEVKWCGICGSDMHSVYPVGSYLGHEFTGVISEVGKNVKDWKPGDRVTAEGVGSCGECYGCKHGRQSQCEYLLSLPVLGVSTDKGFPGAYAKFVRIPHKRLHSLPDEVSFEEGTLVEPLACSLHAVRISDFKTGDHALVLGVGGIGLGVITFLKNTGAGSIVAVMGKNKKRGEVAKKLGADYVFNPQEASKARDKVLELTNGRGVDVVFDCSGVAEAFQSATKFLRKGGLVLLKGVITKEVPIRPMDWAFNEWRLQSSFCYYSDEYPMVIDFLKKTTLPVKEMITSRIKLSDIVEKGFKKLLTPGNNEIKIIVEPDV